MDYAKKIVWLVREVARVKSPLLHKVASKPHPAIWPHLPSGEGRDLENFLNFVEFWFAKMVLERQKWKFEPVEYLKGDALNYWLHLSGTCSSQA